MRKLLLSTILQVALLAICIGGDQQLSNQVEQYVEAIKREDASGQTCTKLFDLYMSGRSSDRELAESVIEACWETEDTTVQAKVVMISQRFLKRKSPKTKNVIMHILEKATDRSLIFQAVGAIGSQDLTKDDANRILVLSGQLDQRTWTASDRLAPDKSPEFETESLYAVAGAIGPDAYSMLKIHAGQHPDVPKRIWENWDLILITTRHPDAVAQAMEKVRANKIPPEQDAKGELKYTEYTRYLRTLEGVSRSALHHSPQSQQGLKQARELGQFFRSVAEDETKPPPVRSSAISSLIGLGFESDEFADLASQTAKRHESCWRSLEERHAIMAKLQNMDSERKERSKVKSETQNTAQ